MAPFQNQEFANAFFNQDNDIQDLTPMLNMDLDDDDFYLHEGESNVQFEPPIELNNINFIQQQQQQNLHAELVGLNMEFYDEDE